LDLLREGLVPFVERELQAHLGDNWLDDINQGRRHDLRTKDGQVEWDNAAILGVIKSQWNTVFTDTLGPSQRTFVFELQDVRNNWAHEKPFSYDQTYRALDTVRMLLEAISAKKEAEKAGTMAEEVMRVKFTEQARNVTRKAAAVTVDGQPKTGLKPWREVVTPHADVASGQYQQAEFAADLSQVHRGEGSSEYRDPKEFFRRTFITKGLHHLLTGGLKRIMGQGGDPVVELQTNFGGGKTHSMLALYHLFSGGGSELSGMEPLLQEVGVDRAPKANRAVLVGTALGPAQQRTEDDGTVVNTLWGELAWQLGGSAGYKMIESSDKQGVSPGKEDLLPLFDEFGPALILIDEWVAYLRQLYKVEGLAGGSFDANLTFAQALTEAVKARKNILLVASLPASQIEIGGQGGQEALQRLEQTFSRVESPWKPADPDEGFEIVRRRLFEPIADHALRDVAVKAYGEMYRGQKEEFPSECSEGDYLRRMELAYPIHPKLFDILYEDWSTLDKFQRTRGVLRLMASVIHALWEKDDRGLLIMPSSIPLDDAAVSFELLRYMSDNWEGVVSKDIDGDQSLPLTLDRENPNFGRYSACRRVARSVFMASAPLVKSGNPGVDARVVKLSCAWPGETVATFGDALRLLSDRATYLYVDGARTWFDTTPNVTRTAQDRANQLRADDVDAYISSILTDENKGAGKRGMFAGLHVVPDDTADVPDDLDTRLVVFGPDKPHKRGSMDSQGVKAAAQFLNQRGSSPRIFKNALIFLAPDAARLEDLRTAVRQYLAWKSVVADEESLNLTAFAKNQAKTKRDDSAKTVQVRLHETWIWTLVPSQGPDGGEIGWDDVKVATDESMAGKVGKKLVEQGTLYQVLGPAVLKLHLDKWLWQDKDHISVTQLREYLATYLYLPRITGQGVLAATIETAIAELIQDNFGFADEFTEIDGQAKYVGLRISNAGMVSVSGKCVLVRPEVAKKLIDAEAAKTGGGTGEEPTVPGPGPSPDQPDGPDNPDPPKPAEMRRFYASIEIKPDRPTKHMGTVVQEVLQHLTTLPGAKAKMTLEVQIELKDGVSEKVRRDVSENARTLKIENFWFEE